MATDLSFLDELLDTDLAPLSTSCFTGNIGAREQQVSLTPIQLQEGEIDPRLKLLSHSSLLTLHLCPRKYELYKLNSRDTEEDDINSEITFSYGHAVGAGIQSILQYDDEDKAILAAFLAWDVDLDASNPKQKKSFPEAVWAIQRFYHLVHSHYAEMPNLDEYELVYYNGKPAIELSFRITLPDGFTYRAYIDAVLRHRESGKILVLELKTSSWQPNHAMYKNSFQALGYSVVLDTMFPGLSSYTVFYVAYHTKSKEYYPFEFTKNLLQRANWLQSLLLDLNIVQLYAEYNHFPTHGESCFSFGKECEYFGMCELDRSHLTQPLTQVDLDRIAEETYDFEIDIQSLIDSQIAKGEG